MSYKVFRTIVLRALRLELEEIRHEWCVKFGVFLGITNLK
jgi:hypothetical protein